MELGEKLRKARLEAGMSQRELAGDRVTRNMLSQIENGSARPSMKTLQYLAGKLGKSAGYFLDEEGPVSPNWESIASARRLYAASDPAGAVQALEGWKSPDPVFDGEMKLLRTLCYLELAEKAAKEGREIYALSLLEKTDSSPYCGEELERRRLLMLGRLSGQRVSGRLPSLDGELLLRAGEALAQEQPDRAAQLLEAAENHSDPRWRILRGDVHMARREFRSAARNFHHAETVSPEETAPRLETCYRELGDYRRAYEYACKQK